MFLKVQGVPWKGTYKEQKKVRNKSTIDEDKKIQHDIELLILPPVRNIRFQNLNRFGP